MATSSLSTDNLNFLSSGSTQAKLTATASTLTFEGVSAAACKLTGLATPTANSDAANKQYVDNVASGLSYKDAVRAATTAAGTLATSFANTSVIDGVTLATNDRILIKNQATASENGIYVVAASGAPSRAEDLAAGVGAAGIAVFVTEGSTNADTGWVCTSDGGSDVVGTNNLAFAQFSATSAVGGSDTQILYNSSGVSAGLSTFTTNGTNLTLSGGNLTVGDSDLVYFGAGSDLSITHNGTNSIVTSATGDLTVDNTNATGSTIMLLGTDTSATDFQVQNNSASALLTVDGSGQATISGNLNVGGGVDITADSTALTIGAGADITVTHTGTESLITSITGNFTIDNTATTGFTQMRLGTDTSATGWSVNNNSDFPIFSVDGAGTIAAAGVANFNDTTQSTSSTTGSVIIDGGVGIAKDVFCAGSMSATSFNATSDATLKMDVHRLVDPLQKLRNIEAYEYKFKNDTTRTKYGVLAQELVKNGFKDMVAINSNGHLAVDYNNIVGLLIAAVKDLQNEVERLKEKVN